MPLARPPGIHHITRALEKAGGGIHGAHGAAELLGINPGTLRCRMKKLGINFGRNTSKEKD